MLVSVVMAAYDAEAYVGAAIASVREQTHDDWELLVVDDGSRDRTAEIAHEFADERIRVLAREHLGVLGAVRNAGIEAARGEIVALLDTDDLWLPAKLERQVARFAARPEVGVVHTGGDALVGEDRRPFPVPPSGPLLPALLANNFVISSSAAIRRSVLERDGAFDPDPALRGSPDYELWLRLAPRTEFDYVAERLVLYRQHPTQMSSDLRSMSLGGLAALDRARARDGVEVPARRTGVLAYLAGDRARARRELRAAVARRPWDARAWRWLVRASVGGRRGGRSRRSAV